TSDTTTIGTGFHLGDPQFAASGRVALFGTRYSLSTVACGSRGCAAPVGIAVEGADLPDEPGRRLNTIIPTSFAGDGDTMVFLANTVGTERRRAIVRASDGVLEVVASQGQPLPGGIGTIL